MALSDIAATAPATPWRTCAVCHALSTIPDAEAAGLRSLLASGMRYTEMSEALAADDDTPLQLPPDTLSRHARGRCEAREKLR